jgi:hypothetical protein
VKDEIILLWLFPLNAAIPPFSQVADPPTRGFRPRATWLRCLKRSGTQEGTVSSWIPLRSIQATLA